MRLPQTGLCLALIVGFDHAEERDPVAARVGDEVLTATEL